MAVVLRRFCREDAEPISRYLSEGGMHAFLPDHLPCPYPLERAHRFLDWAIDAFPMACAVSWRNDLVGAITLRRKEDVFRPNMELGYWIAAAFQGRGIGREAVTQITRTAFRQPGIERVYALVFESNFPSLRLLEGAGYVLEARMENGLCKGEELHSCLLYSALRGPWMCWDNNGGFCDR